MLEYDIKTKKLTVSPYLVKIKAFEAILNHSKHLECLTAMYHLVNPLSSYSQYNEDMRVTKVVEDVLNSDHKIVESKAFCDALEKYKVLSHTPLTRSLDSAQSLLHRIKTFFDTVDFNERTNSGSVVYKPKDVLSTMKELSNAADEISKLEKKVRNEEEVSQEKLRRGVVINEFND